MTEDPKLVLACVGDLHVREERTQSFREMFSEILQAAKVLVLCGDLTDMGKPKEAEILAEDLRACAIPVVGVLGNHDYESDQVEKVADILKSAGVHLLDGQTYEVDGVGFVGVKGFIGGFASETFAGPVGHPVPEVGMGPIYPLVIAATYRTVGRSAAPCGGVSLAVRRGGGL